MNFVKNLLERYEHRPHSLNNMCLAEFVVNYSATYVKAKNDDLLLPATVYHLNQCQQVLR